MTKKSELVPFNPVDKSYAKLLEEAKKKIFSARILAAKAICQEQINLYWWFGERIVTAQEKHGWGRSIVEQLSTDIRKAFNGTRDGFSPRNLWDMRRFYLEYKDFPNLRQLVAEIPWGQHLVILSKVKEMSARIYYLEATRDMGWTRKVLELQVESQAYERHMLESKNHNFQKALPVHLAEQAERAMKSIYKIGR